VGIYMEIPGGEHLSEKGFAVREKITVDLIERNFCKNGRTRQYVSVRSIVKSAARGWEYIFQCDCFTPFNY